MREIDYDAEGLLPTHMRDAVRRYLENRIEPGGFLIAVLSNDLFGAAGRADHINARRLHDICAWFHQYAPAHAYGSPDAVRRWLTGETPS